MSAHSPQAGSRKDTQGHNSQAAGLVNRPQKYALVLCQMSGGRITYADNELVVLGIFFRPHGHRSESRMR